MANLQQEAGAKRRGRMMSGDATKKDPLPNQTGNPADAMSVHDDGFEASMQRRWWIIWWVTLIAPIALTIAILTILGILYGLAYVRNLVATSIVTFFFFGRFIILGGNENGAAEAEQFFSHGQLFLMVMYMDFLCAILLTFHMGFLFKLPVLGEKFKQLADDGRYILKTFPLMRRATIAGIVAFVMFPLAATGSIGGSILGRMLGLARLTTFLCVMAGSLLGCGAMYYGAALINKYLDKDNPLVVWGGIAFIGLIIFILNNRYHKMKAMRKAEEERETGAS